MELSSSVDTVFVYGTLKQNQSRGKQWPIRPLGILPAIVPGTLVDFGPYPGLLMPEDPSHFALGEIWFFRTDDMETTLKKLDWIEGYHPKNPRNEYERQIIQAYPMIEDWSLAHSMPRESWFALGNTPCSLDDAGSLLELGLSVPCWTYISVDDIRISQAIWIEARWGTGPQKIAEWTCSTANSTQSN